MAEVNAISLANRGIRSLRSAVSLVAYFPPCYARCRLRNTIAFVVLQPIGLYGTAANSWVQLGVVGFSWGLDIG